MLSRLLKVLFVSAEVAPFSSVGGLSQVSYFLSRALLKLGVDIRLFTPKYGTGSETKFPTKMLIEGLKVPTGEEPGSSHPQELICNVKVAGLDRKTEPTVYFLENMEYFEKRANVYGYSDDHIRFGLLSRAACEFLKTEHFLPDLIHANDWHSAYLINFLRDTYRADPALSKIATVLSVHNLYQGAFDFAHATETEFDDGKSELAPFFSEAFYKQNALKRGIIDADVVNTVSETYSREIMTPEYGAGLHNLFKELRGKLYGVLNGLDYQEFNPATDKILYRNFNAGSISLRAEDKTDLQKEFNLKLDANTPLLAVSGRLDSQKGLDLIIETLPFLLEETNIQFVALGSGEQKYKGALEQIEKKYPGRVGLHLMTNFTLPRKIFAGADIILLPSFYEPGGIVAMEAMRYGAVPVVRATGGLADSVIDYNPLPRLGTGFSFKNFTRESFLMALVRALEAYKDKKAWQELIKRAMSQDFSWARVAQKYQQLYERAREFRKEALSPNPPAAFRQTVA